MTEHPIRLDEVWAFCTARLDDDEKAALATTDDEISEQLSWAEVRVGDAIEHIERHLPTRALAAVVFKRELLTEHEPALQAAVKGSEVTPMLVCRIDGDDCPVTQGLAALYADHPDYREAWQL